VNSVLLILLVWKCQFLWQLFESPIVKQPHLKKINKTIILLGQSFAHTVYKVEDLMRKS